MTVVARMKVVENRQCEPPNYAGLVERLAALERVRIPEQATAAGQGTPRVGRHEEQPQAKDVAIQTARLKRPRVQRPQG